MPNHNHDHGEHGHNHHHDHDHDHDHDDIVILEDEDGKEHEFIIAETFEVNTVLYAVLVSADGTSEEGYIFRVEEKEEAGETFLDFVPIEDEQEWQEVEKTYNEMLEDDEDAD